MPKQGTRVEVNTFVQGIITEASPLNFPPNATLDEENFELRRDGTRDRRLGMDLETGYATNFAQNYAEGERLYIGTFRWYSVNGLLNNDFIVIQAQNVLYFYDVSEDSISSDGFLGSLSLTSFPTLTRYSFAALEGKLVVVGGYETVAVIEYDSTGGTFSAQYVSLKVRDIWGVEETGVPSYETDPSYRGAIDDIHRYNLRNQSWGIPRKNSSGTSDDPLDIFYAEHTEWPSNSETVWPGLQFQASATDPFERVFPKLYDDVLGAETIAPKGYFIIDLLKRGTSRETEFAANTTKYPILNGATFSTVADASSGGATVVREFAGRVFYAGFSGSVTGSDARSPDLSNFVAFSQLVKNVSDINKCYQEGDPTSRDSSDILATDGGTIKVAGAEKILGLEVMGSSLIVFASNGVWAIRGGSDYGFNATEYKVDKISTFGTISPDSIVVEGNRIYYWSEDGIYLISASDLGDLGAQSITRTTIQTLYESISQEAKSDAQGLYDIYNKRVKWIYKEGDPFTATSETHELVFDTTLGAFYKNRIFNLDDNSVEVVNFFTSPAFNIDTFFEGVYVGSDQVLANTDVVGVDTTIRSSGFRSVRYAVLIKDGTDLNVTFAYYNNSDFVDWESKDGVGVDAEAYMITGTIIAGDSAVPKQIPYMIMHFRRTEDGVLDGVPTNQSSCLVRSQWDWSDSALSNKWSPFFQAYRYRRPLFIEEGSTDYDNGFEVVTSKNKIRGRGKSFAFYMKTEPLKDCRILGWNLTINGNPIA